MIKFLYLLQIFIFPKTLKNKYKRYLNLKAAYQFLSLRNKAQTSEISNKEKIFWTIGQEDLTYLKYAFPNNTLVENKKSADVILKWGMNRLFRYTGAGKKIFIAEDSFLRSLTTMADKKADKQDKLSISFTLDDLAPHFCGTHTSRLEQKINSDTELTKQDLERSRKCINKIVENHLTKYNHQPIFIPEVLKTTKHKVLIIDQSAGDYSIVLGGNGKQADFDKMLADAIKENPNSMIFIKVHPDTLCSKKSYVHGYFSQQNTKYENVVLFAENVNPIAVLKNVDKVYVWSSGMGFEALMCGKEVVTYGTPFYAGWGLTTDKHPIFQTNAMKQRRNRQRSLEEVFYFSYIWYSHYVNPETQNPCEIENAMDYLLSRRKEHFAKAE